MGWIGSGQSGETPVRAEAQLLPLCWRHGRQSTPPITTHHRVTQASQGLAAERADASLELRPARSPRENLSPARKRHPKVVKIPANDWFYLCDRCSVKIPMNPGTSLPTQISCPGGADISIVDLHELRCYEKTSKLKSYSTDVMEGTPIDHDNLSNFGNLLRSERRQYCWLSSRHGKAITQFGKTPTNVCWIIRPCILRAEVLHLWKLWPRRMTR
jgi:hypothetical protein